MLTKARDLAESLRVWQAILDDPASDANSREIARRQVANTTSASTTPMIAG